MDDFKALLNKQIQKATATAAPEEKPAPKAKPQSAVATEPPPTEDQAAPAPEAVVVPTRAASPQRAQKKAGKGSAGRNINRVTVNLFEADSRALAVIRELLGSAGHDFSSRSDSMKVGLRLAAKAKPEELAKILEQVRSEDRRFRSEGK
jgi:outer membrane biosynthesis protein TonB